MLPFLHGDRFVARVDLKADRPNRALLVPGGVFGEEDIDEDEVAAALATELRTMARWLDLDDVVIEDPARRPDRGDLSGLVRAMLSETGDEPSGTTGMDGAAL